MEPQEITQLREDLQETHDQFAGRIGVSANTIRRWERGEGKPFPYWQIKLRKLRQKTDRTIVKAE